MLQAYLVKSPSTNRTAVILDAASSVAKRHNYYISARAVMDRGDSIFFLSPEGTKRDTVGALLPVESALRGDLYVAYVAGRNLQPIFEQAIFGTDATATAPAAKVQETYLHDLELICTYILAGELQRRKLNAGVSASADFESPEVRCTSSANEKLELMLNADFIKRNKPMNHGERNAQAYKELAEQITKMPN